MPAKKNPTSIVAVPKELIQAQERVTLCVDFFFINRKHIFLMTYSENICFTTNTHVIGTKVKHYWSFLKDIYMMYLNRGLKIVRIRADLEFSAIQVLVNELPTRPRMIIAAQGEHVGPIERNIRYAKEKIRSLRYTLPFEKVPKFVIVYMVFNATIVMNMFPRKGGSQHYSPQAIMSGRGVSIQDLEIPFGSYVQVTNATEPHNSLEPRTRGAIALGMMGNETGGRVLMALDTGKLIRRSHARVIPMTAEIIARVNYLGRGEPSLLTFQNRRGEDIGERTVNRIEESESDVLPIEHDMLESPEITEDLVDDATGVESPYEEYVDEWNDMDVPRNHEGVPEGGDDTDQAHEDRGVPESAFEVETAQAVEFETVQEDSGSTSPREESTPAQDSNGRPIRVRKPVSRLIPSFEGKSYGTTFAQVGAQMFGMTMTESIRHMEEEMVSMGIDDRDEIAMGVILTNMSIKKSIAKLGFEPTMKSSLAEMKQIHMRDSFVPKHFRELTPKQIARMVESFLFLKEKKDGTLKARAVLGGNVQRDYITKDEASSPTAYTEAVILTAVADAKEKRKIATVDLPNAFCQTVITDADAEHRIIVRLRGALVDMLVEIAPEVYKPYVTINKKGEKVLLVQCMNALYGSMVASLMFYKKLAKALISYGFVYNPYDSCVANKVVEGETTTICHHVDDCKISHVSEKVVDNIISLLKRDFEIIFEDGSGSMQVRRGDSHVYVGMTLDYSHPGQVRISMVKHVDDIIETWKKAQSTFDGGLIKSKRKSRSSSQITAAPKDLFDVNEECEALQKSDREAFHKVVAKALYVAKRARPDISTAISFLTKRVLQPNREDWEKLAHMVRYLEATRKMPLILSADDSDNLYWYADSAFAVHPNMRSHNGAGLTRGRGFIISISSGQKLNTGSSTHAELVCVSDILPMSQWVRLFEKSQGRKVTRNIIYQDNESAELLAVNGKKSSSKRTRHINIRYFLVTDAIAKGECEVKWISRDYMFADYFTKAQQGSEFRKMRDFIMGVNPFEETK
jgi:hypothetical protein